MIALAHPANGRNHLMINRFQSQFTDQQRHHKSKRPFEFLQNLPHQSVSANQWLDTNGTANENNSIPTLLLHQRCRHEPIRKIASDTSLTEV